MVLYLILVYTFEHMLVKCRLNSNTQYVFLFLILVLNKVASFCIEARTFLSEEVRN